ncbi:MAG: hypothetical protein KDA44_06835 [Planctomycetales bacterium]|nr:hypothetical protein [Planctomycetales bacterium]
MKSTTLRCLLAVFVLALISSASPVRGDITFFFKKSPSGGVNVAGSGSGLVDRVAGIASNDWDIQDFVTNFLVDTYTDVQTGADTVSGTFSNMTTGVTETILNFDVDRDGGASFDNDLDFDTANVLTFSFEDEFALSLTASFDPGTLAFSDLILGTHIDEGHTQGAGISEESFGITRVVVVVPEPGALALLLIGAAAIAYPAGRRCLR